MRSIWRASAIIAVIGLLLALAGLTVLAADNNQGEDEDEGFLYYCPNHPEIRSDKPAVCPKCGAQMIKKEGRRLTGGA